MTLLIQNGRLLDPASGVDASSDLLIEGGVVKTVAPAGTLRGSAASEVVDASGKWILPGLIDIHVHLREPGQEYKEDIESGSRAAAHGGFTTIVAMPNTEPVIDNAELVAFVRERGRTAGLCRVLPTGAVTVGQKGKALAPIGEMAHAGAVAITDDGYPVANPALFRSALEYAQDFNLPVLSHSEDLDLSADGHMHEGRLSTRLGLRGKPRTAEDAAVARDILLAEYSSARLHVCHVSTQGAVDLIRAAKARGVRVTAEAAPHHFALTDEAVVGFNTSAKMNPPLREGEDVEAVIAGLADGTIDAIATDHAPHSTLEKDVAFADAANGVIGLQTALPLALDLYRRGRLPLLDVIDRLTSGPARALNLPYGSITEGSCADMTLVDPEATWTVTTDLLVSKSKNSAFLGQQMHGRAVLTVLEGRVVYRHSDSGI